MKKRKLSAAMAALVTLIGCLLLSGGGLAFYATTVRPSVFQAQATTVARNFVTAQAQATYQGNLRSSSQATATASFDNYLYLQTIHSQPILNDPLNLTDLYWQQGTVPNAGCTFTGGAYHVQISLVGNYYPCLLQTNTFSDFAFQVNMTLIKGDSGGIIFHVVSNGNSSDAYLFNISLSGDYSLLLIHNGQLKILAGGYNQAIHGGLHVSNQLMVIAHGHTILLFVNNQLVDSASDSTLTSGAIGVFAFDIFDPTDMAFSNAQVWTL